MKKIILYFSSIFAFLFVACEEEFIPEIDNSEPDMVVEGYIEAGEVSLPPYVFLTRSQPFFSELNFGNFGDFFVHDALVTIDDGMQTVELEELCWLDLTQEQREIVNLLLSQSGIGGFDSIPGNLCVYFDLDFEMQGEIGRTYDLRIEAEGKILTASTTLVERVPLDSLRFITPEGNVADTLKELRVIFKDPPNAMNYYRYFTSTNGSEFTAGFNSVADDAFFDGEEFEFPLPEAEPRNTDASPSTFGLYTLGDTVTIKWTTIDGPHFNFWNTLEFNAINQGPFAAYTRIESNITGGLGIWGGYSSYYYPLIVEE